MKIIPELRFPEFEKEGQWVIERLDRVVSNFIVPMRDKPKKLDGPIPWCRIEDFDGMYLSSSKSNQGVSLETIEEMNLKVYPVNSLLVSCSADLGRCAITAKELVTNQTFIGLVPNTRKANTIYLYFIMSNSRNELNARSSGTTISYLSRQEFEKFEIPIPPDEDCLEQQKIASCLSSLDELIAAHKDKLDALKDHKKGLLQNLFPQEGETVPKVRFPEFEGDGEWEIKRVEDFFDVGSSKRVLQKDWTNDGVPFYRTRELVSLSKNEPFGSEIFISEDLYIELKESYGVPVEGDFLVSGVGTLGVIYQVKKEDKFYFKDGNVIWFSKREELDSSFFEFCFESSHIQNQIDAQTSKSTVGTYTIKNARITEFWHPPRIEEQQKIASCLSAVDELITAQQDKIEQLQQHKKGLMQGLFPKIKS